MMGKSISIKDIMTAEVITVQPDDTMEKVRDIFERRNIHHIPVVSGGKLAGIISREDYLRVIQGFNSYSEPKRAQSNAALLRSMLVGEVMVRQVARLGPEDSLQTAAGFFRENLFHAIPVVGASGELLGILTTYDLINYAYQEGVFG
jgi:CBS domain-containing protein